MAFDQRKYIDDWNRKNIDRVTIKIPKGRKKHCKILLKTGIPMNQLIIAAVEEKYKIDLTTK